MNISEEIDSKLFALLNACLQTLASLLEIIGPSYQTVAFFDELLSYLKSFLHYVPEKCVICIKQLIKYMFSTTYTNRKEQYEILFNCPQASAKEIFDSVENFRKFNETNKNRVEVPSPSENTTSNLINLLASTSTPEKHKAKSNTKNIKLFEPIVIQCLKVCLDI